MRLHAHFQAAVALSAVLICLACKSEPPAADTQGAPASAPASPANPHANMQPADPHAMNPHAPAAAAGGADLSTPATAGGLTWSDAAPLARRAPKSSMRAAEYGLADDDKLELTVFYFGPDQGGSVDANITRWLGQITQPDGKDTKAKAKRATRSVGDINVSTLEVAGTYSGSMMMPGAAPAEPMTGAMMLAAIATGPQGPVFSRWWARRPRSSTARSVRSNDRLAAQAVSEANPVKGWAPMGFAQRAGNGARSPITTNLTPRARSGSRARPGPRRPC